MTGRGSFRVVRGGVYRYGATVLVAGSALIPILLMSLLGRHYAQMLVGVAPVGLDLTNLSAFRDMILSASRLFDYGDSWIPMRQALKVFHDDNGGNIYKIVFFDQGIRFQYPPTSLLPLDVLAAFGILNATVLSALNCILYCVNAVAVGCIAWLLFRGQPDKTPTGTMQVGKWPPPDPVAMAVLSVVVAFVFYPLMRAQVLGQIQVWIDALFSIAVICWLRGSRLQAGICIGLACTIKPQLAVLLVWGLLWKEFGFGAGVLIGLVPIAGISLFHYGVHNHLAYLDVLGFLSRRGESFFANNSVNGILNAYLSPSAVRDWTATDFTSFNSTVYAGTLAASLIAIALVILPPLLERGRKAGVADLGAAAICCVAGSPVAWEHHYGILLPIYLVAVRLLFEMPGGARRALYSAVTLVSWLLVANIISFVLLLAQTPFRFAQAHFFFGALLLLPVLFGIRERNVGLGADWCRDDSSRRPWPRLGGRKCEG